MITLDRRRIAVFVAGASAFLDMYCTQALLPDLARHFDASPAEVGLTVTMSTLATALVAPMVGAMADMWGRKRLIVFGALALVLPTMAIAVVDSLPAILALRFLQGLCLPAIFTVTMAYVGEEWPAAEVPEVVSIYTGGTALGGVSGRLVTAVAADFVGWRDAFLVLGAVNLAAGLLIWALLPAARGWRPSGSLVETLRAAFAHWRNPRLVATFGIGFTILFALVATFTYGTFYLAAWPFLLSTTGQGLVFLVYLLGTVSAPVGGKVIARIGAVRGMALAVAAVCCGLLLTLVQSFPVVVAGLGLMVCGIFVCQTASISTISATAKTSRSAAMGMYVTLYYTGGSLGAVVPAPLWHLYGWPGPVFTVIVVSLGGLALAWRWWAPARV